MKSGSSLRRTSNHKGSHHKMYMTINRNRLYPIIGRTAVVAFFAVVTTLGLHAQQSSGTAPSLPAVNLKTPLAPPLNLSSSSSSTDDLGYSSSVGAAETANAELFSFGATADQPPPRRRYGRPNYNDSHTNSDGSAKYSFFAGGGFGLPTGGTHNDLTTGWGLQFGGGRNFNKKFGVAIQFDYDHFGFQTNTLNNLLAIYNSLCTPNEQAAGNCAPFTQLGGNSHIWSFTVDPRYTFYDGDKTGAYVVGGFGFYHKTATFTIPAIGTYCDPFYGCYQYQANQPIDSYTSNAPGINGGVGMTYKFSRFASARFYAEARYVYIFNQSRPFDVSGTTAYFNAFPQNSAKTSYIPVKFGIRF
jgi:hypothetical protein